MFKRKSFFAKITSFIAGVFLLLALAFAVSTPTQAQFITSPTPTPTLTILPLTGGATPTATPTIRIATPTPAATTPAAGNALPTMVILGSALAFLSLGLLVWRSKLTPQSS